MTNKYFLHRDRCPACNTNMFKVLYQRPFDSPPIREYLNSFYKSHGGVDFEYLKDSTYNLCECKGCGLIYQKEIPNDYLMKMLYEKWIDPKEVFNQHTKNDNLNFYTYYAQEISTIIAYLQKLPSELSFFDFGMGWGKWAMMAKGFGCDSYGTELSEERIKYATSNGIKVLTWGEIPRYKFDFINTEQVFEHIPNPLETLIFLKDSLKSNGILKISVPSAIYVKRRLKLMDWNAAKGTKNSLNMIAPLEHINCFRRKSLIKMAAIADLKEVNIPLRTQYKYTTSWNGRNRIAKNLLLPIFRNVFKIQNYLFFRQN